jgi:PKHD-type hydroxylase
MSARELPFLWSPPPDAPAGIAFIDEPGAGHPPVGGAQALHPNPHLQDVQLYESVFSGEECERIAALGQSRPRWGGRSTSRDPSYRVCVTSWLEEDSQDAWVFERIAQVVSESNAVLGFELAGFGEPLHYIEYGAGGGFEWHTDLGSGRASNRKLSVSVQLSSHEDYTGGELELCPHGVMKGFRDRGSVLVFPAFIPHRVLRIGSGLRRALVAWIHGPAYR